MQQHVRALGPASPAPKVTLPLPEIVSVCQHYTSLSEHNTCKMLKSVTRMQGNESSSSSVYVEGASDDVDIEVDSDAVCPSDITQDTFDDY